MYLRLTAELKKHKINAPTFTMSPCRISTKFLVLKALSFVGRPHVIIIIFSQFILCANETTVISISMPLPFENSSNKGTQVPLPVEDKSSKDKQEEDFSKWPIPDEYTIYFIDNYGVKQKSVAQDPRYELTKLLKKAPTLSDKAVAELKASKTTPRTWEEELGLRKKYSDRPSVPFTPTDGVVVNVTVDCNQSRTEGLSIESPLSIDDDDDGDAGSGNHPSTNNAIKWRTKGADLVLLREVEKVGAHVPEAGAVNDTWTKVSEAMQRLGFTVKCRAYQKRFHEILKSAGTSTNPSDEEALDKMDSTERQSQELLWNIKVDIDKFKLKAEKDAKEKAEKEAKLNAAGKDIRDKGALAIRDGLSVFAAGGETFIDGGTGEIMARRSPSEAAIPLIQFKSPGKQDSAAKQVSSAKKHGGEDLVRALLGADSSNSDRKLALEEQKLQLQREELHHKQEMERNELQFRMEESKQAATFRMEESRESSKRWEATLKIKLLALETRRPSKKHKAAESDSDSSDDK
jgi:hypothetical protein